METPKRLTPVPQVTRQLYLASGNRCAFPGCEEALMRPDGVLVGEIAHIEGALPGSPRFSSKMTNGQRRMYENLLLLCGTHHTVIDNDVLTWTVARLRELKRQHEAIYTAAIDRLRRQVGDVTEGVSFTPAVNGLAILGGMGLDAAMLQECVKDLNQFGARLSRVPGDARSVLALIVARGEETPSHMLHSHWAGEIQIPVSVLRSLADCSARQLRQHAEVLEHFEFLVLPDEAPPDGPPVYVVGNSTPSIGWPLLRELRNLESPHRPVVRRVLCDLDLTAFDEPT